MRLISLFVALILLISGTVWAAAQSARLPSDYRKWHKSGRKIVTDKSSLFYGIHYIYADPKAMKGYGAGNRFPEGSSIVVEFFNIKEEGGRQLDGPKNMVVMMKKDRKRTETGGWLFAGFGADGKPSGIDPVRNCFDCHKKDASDREFVISTLKDIK